MAIGGGVQGNGVNTLTLCAGLSWEHDGDMHPALAYVGAALWEEQDLGWRPLTTPCPEDSHVPRTAGGAIAHTMRSYSMTDRYSTLCYGCNAGESERSRESRRERDLKKF